jgi:hypothetical protein
MSTRLVIDRAGRVVRVDDDQGPRPVGDLGLDVGEIGVPGVLLVAHVVHGMAAGQGHRAGPQRVVGRGHEHLVAVVDEGLQHQGDELADAVADEDVLDVDVLQAVALVVLRDRRPGRIDAAAVGVALGVRQVVDHAGDDGLGGLEAEGGGVADVQLEDFVPLGLEALGLDEDGPADVVADVAEFFALHDRTHPAILPQRWPRAALR